MTRLVLCLLLLAPSLLAHDLFLVVEGAGAKRKVCARIGEHFPESMNPLKLERIERFTLSVGSETVDLHGEVDEAAKQTCAPLPYGAQPGTKVELTSKANFIELEAKDFNSYIEGEGFARVMVMRQQAGKTGSAGRELYSRYAKAILPGDADPTRPMLHELEIVPLKDPGHLKKSEALPVRVLFRGKPLAGVRVSAVYAGAKLEGHAFPVNAITDEKGEAALRLDRTGLWYARLIHMLPSAEAGSPGTTFIGPKDAKPRPVPPHDWRSFFATLTFEVPK